MFPASTAGLLKVAVPSPAHREARGHTSLFLALSASSRELFSQLPVINLQAIKLIPLCNRQWGKGIQIFIGGDGCLYVKIRSDIFKKKLFLFFKKRKYIWNTNEPVSPSVEFILKFVPTIQLHPLYFSSVNVLLGITSKNYGQLSKIPVEEVSEEKWFL